jgi:hypothetical protein
MNSIYWRHPPRQPHKEQVRQPPQRSSAPTGRNDSPGFEEVRDGQRIRKRAASLVNWRRRIRDLLIAFDACSAHSTPPLR